MQYLSVLFELISLIAAIAWCRKAPDLFFLFIPYLIYIVLNEGLGAYIGIVLDKKNYILFTIYKPIELTFFSSIIANWVYDKKNKRLIKTLMIAGLLFCLINAAFIQGLSEVNTYSNTLVSVIMIGICSIFLLDFLKKTELVSSPLADPGFWVIAGLLFFYFGGMVLYILYNYVRDQNFRINGVKMYRVVFQFLIFLMYGCLTIAFWKIHKKKKLLEIREL